MAQIYNRLTLDVKKKNHDIITAVQNDASSRYLDINLIDNGVNINLTGHEVRLYARKPDQTEVYNNGQITNAAQGRVQIELTSQLLAKEGYVEAQVITYKNNQQILSTLPFKIHVVSNLMSDNAIESSNEYGALVILYQNLYEAYDLMTTMVQRIGTPEANAQQLNLNTMFKVWDWLIQYLRDHSSAGVMDSLTSLHTKSDNIKNETTEIKAKVTTLQAKTNTAEEPLNYQIWMTDVITNGANGYVIQNTDIFGELYEKGNLWRKNNKLIELLMQQKEKLNIDVSNRIGSKMIQDIDWSDKRSIEKYTNKDGFTRSIQVLKPFFTNDQFIQKIFVEKFAGINYAFGAKGICEIMVDLAKEKPEHIKKILHYTASPSNPEAYLLAYLYGFTPDKSMLLLNEIKKKPNKFQKAGGGYLNSVSNGYYLVNAAGLAGSDVDKSKNYICFVRTEPNYNMQITVTSRDHSSLEYNRFMHQKQPSGHTGTPIREGDLNVLAISTRGRLHFNNSPNGFRVWCEVYKVL